MAAQNFEPSLKLVLEDEGGNDDDPADRAGRTSRGITQREYDAWCHLHGSPTGDVWRATDDTIRQIYYQQYWLPHCDPLPRGLDYVYFDMAVNMGPTQATIILQRALNVADDGHFGVITMNAALRANVALVIEKIHDLKIAFYKEIERERPANRKFDRGWMSRVAHVQKGAEAMLA